MAAIDLSAITALNPLEKQTFSEFILEQMLARPEMSRINRMYSGVKMKEQIVFASQFGKTGIKDALTSRPNSGAGTTLTEKFWEPKAIGDTLSLQQVSINSLFKAYYSKIAKFSDLSDITGTDEFKFLALLLSESAISSSFRHIWLGDTAVAEAAAGTAGVKLAADVKFYDAISGLWDQIFTGVTASEIAKTAISENAETTTVAQLNLASGRSLEIFEDMWANADSRVRSSADKMLLVSRSLYDNYRKYIQEKGQYTNLQLTTGGIPALDWNGVPIISMENIWDSNLQADFVAETTHDQYYLPNRAVLTTPDNIPVATLNENDITEVDSHYDWITRTSYFSYGYTLDAKVYENNLITVAY